MDTVKEFEVDLIDLGAASVETKGGTEILAQDEPVGNFRDEPGLSKD